MATIELRHVWKKYGEVEAVRDLSLTCRDGEFLCLLGPSGCGKSSTMRMVAGLEQITAGDLLIDNRRVNEVPARERDIAMVFENYALYPHLNVYDNIAMPLRARRIPRGEIERRIREVAEILSIVQLLPRSIKNLSGGQKQRVGIGRAIVRHPRLFIMDEPISHLEARLRADMRTELKRLHRRLGVTTLYVTHDQLEAVALADRVAVMQSGVLQQVGSPAELFDRPANEFVAGFIGADRGYRGLQFLQASGLPLHDISRVGEWELATRPDGSPLGWRNADGLVAGGSLLPANGTLRQALDAALSSPSGVGVAVDADGKVIGGVRVQDVLEAIDHQKISHQKSR